MKRTIIPILAAFAIFSACSKNETPAESPIIPEENTSAPEFKEYTYNFSFAKNDADGTKAVKSEWAEGDIVRVFFNGISTGYLELTYSSEAWSVNENSISGEQIAAVSTKKCAAVWIDGDAVPQYSSNAWQFAQGGEMLVASNVSFTITDNVIAASFTLKQHSEFTKVTIKGLEGTDWTLLPKDQWGIAAKAGGISLAADCCSSAAISSAAPYTGIECEEGVYFFVVPAETDRTSFKISNSTASYINTFGNSLAAQAGKAVKFDGITSDSATWLETDGYLYINGASSEAVNGSALSWTINDPVAVSPVNGKYTFTITNCSDFMMSTKKSAPGVTDWNTDWSRNAISAPSDVSAGVPAITKKTWASSFKPSGSNMIMKYGTYIMEVSENFDMITISYPQYLYFAGGATAQINGTALGSAWNVSTPPSIGLQDGKFSFTITIPSATAYVDLSCALNPSKEDWDTWNAGKISPNPKNVATGTNSLRVSTDGWVFNEAGTFRIEIDEAFTTAQVTKL